MKRLSVLLMVSILLSHCLTWVSAYDSETTSEYEGYIIKISDDCGEAQLMEAGLEPLNVNRGLYTCDTRTETLKYLESGYAEYIEPNYIVELLSVDEYYDRQWNLTMINASSAWAEGLEGSGVRIGLIDSGINRSHTDFAGVSIDAGWNFRNQSSDTNDTYGHGTKVASIIAAVRDNGVGIAGITSKATLVPLKCFDSKNCTLSYIIEAVYAAADKFQCDILNLSLGLTQKSKLFETAVQYAADKGVIMTASAGNGGGSEFYYPAAYDCVIGVGSVGKSGNVSSFSQKNTSVFVTAPGGESGNGENDVIYTLSMTGNKVTTGIGASFAAPHVTALAAIAKEYNPNLTLDDFKHLLIATSSDKGDSGYDTSYGYGIIDIAAFIDVMKNKDVSDLSFIDSKGNWAEEYIIYCAANSIMSGVGDNCFSPYASMSRAMFVKSLANLNDSDISGYDTAFTDISEGAWYAQSVAWGAKNGIVTGMSDTEFGPDFQVNREQMAVFIYRYAKFAGYTDMNGDLSFLDIFSDKDDISEWASEAVAWAVEHGLLNGKEGGIFDPSSTATRAEAAAILSRFHKMVRK